MLHELEAAGYDMFATDLWESPTLEGARTGSKEHPESFPERTVYRKCDLRDSAGVAELVEEFKPDLLFHLAAQSSAAESFEDPAGTLEANVFGTLNILEALRRGAVGSRMISVGSSDEYGVRSPGEMPLVESSPLEPVSPYAVSKLVQGMLCLQYWRSYGLQCIVTRSFSHTGPGQSDRFVLPSWGRQCAEIKAGLRENVLKVGNIDIVRDFLDVRDVVRAYRLIGEKGKSGGVYNVCSGEGLELRQALETMIGHIRMDVRIERDPALFRPADAPVLVGSSDRIRRETGWEPRISRKRLFSDLMEYWEARVISKRP